MTLSVPADPNSTSSFITSGLRIFRRAMNFGEIEEPNLSQSQRTSTARRDATFATLTDILSRLGKASRTSLTAKRDGALKHLS